MKKHNFGAGPCILPQEVFKKAGQSVVDLDGIGLSILEISHRSKEFQQILDNARALVKELMGLNDDYEVLFLQGGASFQFAMLPLNLAGEKDKPLYLDTGTWASKAYKEAEKLTQAEMVASSKDKNYNYIPKDYEINESAPYLHITTNNTIFGTQIKEFPQTQVPLVSDMSSDIFSREIDFTQFSLIYAGAQKNIGPAGATLVVVKKEILKNHGRVLPSYLDYQTHVDKQSNFNTPPVFSIYVSYLNLLWLKENGGIKAAEERNKAKADLLYTEIDTNPLFKGIAEKADRSTMNVTFVLEDEAHKDTFDVLCANAGLVGINGHRSVGGYRASIYNALPIESVQVLVNCMRELKNKI